MKWFKHFSNASSEGQLIADIEDQFGLEGYARYFKLLEIVASKMETGDDYRVSYPWSKWCEKLKAKRKKLETFLVYLANKTETNQKQNGNKTEINLKQNGNILEIEIPKLAQLKDNYSKNLQVSGNKVSLDKDKDKDKDIDKKEKVKKEKNPSEAFEKFWEAYPKKTTKKETLEIWEKNKLDFLIGEILSGLASWKLSKQWDDKGGQFIPDPIRFLKYERWRDSPLPISSSNHIVPAEQRKGGIIEI